MLKLIAIVESYDDRFVAWIENTKTLKGMVVEGSSLEEVVSELLTSLKVKIAYDLGIDISSISESRLDSKKDILEFKKKFKKGNNKVEKELSLAIC
jgi:hypothetical protein